MKDYFQSRYVTVISVVAVLSVILLIRLFYVQLVASEYEQFAEENTRTKYVLEPSRGLILDRNGKRLVSNETVYDITTILSRIEPFDTATFCEMLNIDKEYIDSRLQKLRAQGRWFTESVFLKQISGKQIAGFMERQFDFRGFSLRARITRKYEESVAPHILGYMGEVTQNEIEASEDYYRLQDYIGKSGLEKSYENTLRGKKGFEFWVVDKYNRNIDRYAEGRFDEAPESGNTLVSTLDLELQKYGEKLMQNKRGAIVAIEPSSGEVLAMVSSPGFNPEHLTGRERSKFYPLLTTDKNKPLYNRAITAKYPPGSTYKTIMALVALQEGVITPSTRFSCRMGYTIPGLHVGCHAHRNNLALEESIAQSCNAYYCNSFRHTIDQDKFEDTEEGFLAWRDYMVQFGMGIKLGIDIPNEKEGDLPTVAKYDAVYGEGRWRSSYIISLAIGQAEISLTPLQMANMTAIIANKGHYYTPHLVKEPLTKTIERNNVEVEEKHFDVVINGMQKVFETGTARWYALDSVVQCGKTGTAENPHGEDHSNFIAFAPRKNPKIAIAVVVENGGFGSTWAAPMASLMIEKYLTDTTTRDWFEKKMFEKDFIHVPDTNEVEEPKLATNE